MTPSRLQVSNTDRIAAIFGPAFSLPICIQFLRPSAIGLIAFSAHLKETSGQVFALFVITIAAAEVGVGLAIVLLLFRNFRSPDLDEVHQLKG